MDNIQVKCNARTERHTEQEEHHPDFVLNAELIPPQYGPSTHRRRPFVLCNVLRKLWFALNLDFRRKKSQDRTSNPETWHKLLEKRPRVSTNSGQSTFPNPARKRRSF